MTADETRRPPHRGLKKGLYLIPTLFTAANVAMGYLAVLYSIRGYQAAGIDPSIAAGYFNSAGLAIGLAILFDTIDGRVARATRTATEIGVQFDSLADVLTFGIAPTALLYAWAIAPVFPENSPGHNLGVFLLFAFLMCGAFRLARFNLQATRPRVLIEGSVKIDKKAFVGLPIPPAGGLIASLVHFSPMPLSASPGAASQVYVYLILGLVAVLAVLMVSTFRYTSMKGVEKGRQTFLMIVLLAGVAMAIWFYSRYALLVIAAVYVSHGVIWWFFRFLGRFRSPATRDQAV
jgi:CDP-diacylglycerol--serine O-phosphatidyltransferase